MKLHIVNSAPTSTAALASCRRLAQKGDSIVLIENAVYAATSVHAETYLFVGEEGPDVFALTQDLAARGLVKHCDPRITVIDYDGFAALTEAYPSSITWS